MASTRINAFPNQRFLSPDLLFRIVGQSFLPCFMCLIQFCRTTPQNLKIPISGLHSIFACPCHAIGRHDGASSLSDRSSASGYATQFISLLEVSIRNFELVIVFSRHNKHFPTTFCFAGSFSCFAILCVSRCTPSSAASFRP